MDDRQVNPDHPTQTRRTEGRHLLSGWRVVVIVLAASAVFGISHWLPSASSDKPPPASSREAAEPDLTIVDAVISSFRDTGELKYRLLSPEIRHFASSDRTYLSKPDLAISDDPDPPWHVTADRGVISNAAARAPTEEEVLLEENVQMEQQFPDGRNYRLVTPSILIYPERQYAETTRDVMITTHAGRTRAVGLQGSLDQGLLKLFSNHEQRVHTVILPDQFK